jgi:hypothetical protein
MPAKHRPNPKTQETVFRVYHVPEPLRKAMRKKRTQWKQTVQEFIQTAVADELPRLVESLGKLHIGPADPEARPAKLPLDERLLASLKTASIDTGLPQSQLLIACLHTSAGRKRRLPVRRE